MVEYPPYLPGDDVVEVAVCAHPVVRLPLMKISVAGGDPAAAVLQRLEPAVYMALGTLDLIMSAPEPEVHLPVLDRVSRGPRFNRFRMALGALLLAELSLVPVPVAIGGPATTVLQGLEPLIHMAFGADELRVLALEREGRYRVVEGVGEVPFLHRIFMALRALSFAELPLVPVPVTVAGAATVIFQFETPVHMAFGA